MFTCTPWKPLEKRDRKQIFLENSNNVNIFSFARFSKYIKDHAEEQNSESAVKKQKMEDSNIANDGHYPVEDNKLVVADNTEFTSENVNEEEEEHSALELQDVVLTFTNRELILNIFYRKIIAIWHNKNLCNLGKGQ